MPQNIRVKGGAITFRFAGRKVSVIHSGEVMAATIDRTYINRRGLIHEHFVTPTHPGPKDRNVNLDIIISRKDTFESVEAATKELFRRKLKGEI